jgi:hypothetical protein
MDQILTHKSAQGQTVGTKQIAKPVASIAMLGLISLNLFSPG